MDGTDDIEPETDYKSIENTEDEMSKEKETNNENSYELIFKNSGWTDCFWVFLQFLSILSLNLKNCPEQNILGLKIIK